MKYISLSGKYTFKNFLYIFLLSIIPTVFIGILLSPFKIFEFVAYYAGMPVINFGTIFYALIDFNIVSIILTVLGVVIVALFFSLTIGIMENHMRSGKINYKNMGQYVNNNLLVILANFAIVLIFWFILKFLLSAVLFLLHLIFSGISNSPNVFNIIIAICLTSGIFVFFLQVVSVFLLNIPNMLISGYPTKQAIANSIKLLNKNNFQFLVAMLLPFVIIIPLVCLLPWNLMFIANILGVLIIFCYYSSLTMTGYFELSGMPRYDNRKYYYTYK